MLDVIRKHVPILSLLACLALVWMAWGVVGTGRVATSRVPVALAVHSAHMKLPTRPIRVALLAEPAEMLVLEVSGPYQIRPVGSSRVLRTGKKLADARVSATAEGIKIGEHVFAATRLEIVPQSSPAVWVDGHQYRGSMRLFRQKGGRVLAVNVLPLEDYVASVVDSEMPASFPDEARKAQAIVARTYAAYQMRHAPAEAASDLFASTRSQKYLGYQYREGQRLLAGESAAGRRIAEATRGQVCTYRGELFCTYYCAVCGGSTVRGSEVFSDAAPPLEATKCDWCRDAKLYRWTADVSRKDAGTLLAPLMPQPKAGGVVKTISLARTPAGALPEFDVRIDRQTARVSSAEMRTALASYGVYSPRFSIEVRGQRLFISGRGHGHGVGMCQWGARGLAQEGKTCEQILRHYYSGAKIESAR